MTYHHRLIIRTLLVALLLSAQAVAAQVSAPGPLPAPGAGQQAAATVTVNTSPNYLVGANDRLRIIVWNQDNISGEYTVSADGSFTFPLVGRVVAGGLTLASLESELKRMLGAGYFKNPQVTAAVLDYRSKQVFMLGSLRLPGAYPLTGDITVIEALARAGSTTPDAADHVLIIRSPNAQGPVLPGQDESASVTRIDLRQLNAGQLTRVDTVQAGDTIFVPRAATVFVYGQVKNPGSYAVGQETTVRQVLSLAGGVAEFGAANRLKVLRVENGKETEIKVQLNDVLKPGDTIVVPERFF